MLPSSYTGRWVEHVGDEEGHTQGHEGLDQIEDLYGNNSEINKYCELMEQVILIKFDQMMMG